MARGAETPENQRGAIGAAQYIDRSPLKFNEPEWFGRDNVDKEILDLLPPKTFTVTHDELAFMGRAFDEDRVPGIYWLRDEG